MNNSIRLHKEFGLNPTLSQCIICKEDTGEIALLGAMSKEQAPMHSITSIEPCKKCKEKYLSNGVMLVEATTTYKGHYGEPTREPTGLITVLKDEAFTRIFNQPIPKGKICMVEVGVFEKLGIK